MQNATLQLSQGLPTFTSVSGDLLVQHSCQKKTTHLSARGVLERMNIF